MKQTAGDLEKVIAHAGFLGHARLGVGQCPHAGHSLVDAGAAGGIGLLARAGDQIPEILTDHAVIFVGSADLGDARGADHLGEQGVGVLAEILMLVISIEHEGALFPGEGHLVMARVAGDGVEVLQGLGHAAVFDLLDRLELIAVALHPGIDP